jgi:hypothetical protein
VHGQDATGRVHQLSTWMGMHRACSPGWP